MQEVLESLKEREARGGANVNVPPDGSTLVPPVESEFGVWEYHENNPVVPDSAPSAENTPSAEGVTVEPEPAEESDEGLPPWLPWVAAVGAGIWGLNRKPK